MNNLINNLYIVKYVKQFYTVMTVLLKLQGGILERTDKFSLHRQRAGVFFFSHSAQLTAAVVGMTESSFFKTQL